MVEKEIEKTKEKLKEAEEGKMENIHLEDLFWEIKQWEILGKDQKFYQKKSERR